ncbi:transposase [Nannocystaceae bacterium ST9]
MKQTFEYCLARAANENGIQLHAWVVMSNHYHLVLSDPQGRLPAFEQQLNSLVARILNHHWRRRGGFWEIGSYHRVEPLTRDAIVDKIIYTLANPVSAGLVPRARRWDGASSADLEFGQCRRVERPDFLRDGAATEMLHLVAPPSDSGSVAETIAFIRERLHAREREVVDDFAKMGRQFLGMAAILALPWTTTPATEEAPRTSLPLFAGRDREVLKAAIEAWRAWQRAYRHAWEALRSGARDVVFPEGTYMLRVRYGMAVADP